MYCNNCGKLISDDSKFCPECGKEIGVQSVRLEPNAALNSPIKTKKKSKKGNVIIILVLVIMAYVVSNIIINYNKNLNKTDSSVSETSKTKAEAFAEENGISVELAEDLEDVLSKTELDGGVKHNLSSVKGWKQIDNWANGERYGAQLDWKNVYFFYVKDNKIVGIRDDSGNYYYHVDE